MRSSRWFLYSKPKFKYPQLPPQIQWKRLFHPLAPPSGWDWTTKRQDSASNRRRQVHDAGVALTAAAASLGREPATSRPLPDSYLAASK